MRPTDRLGRLGERLVDTPIGVGKVVLDLDGSAAETGGDDLLGRGRLNDDVVRPAELGQAAKHLPVPFCKIRGIGDHRVSRAEIVAHERPGDGMNNSIFVGRVGRFGEEHLADHIALDDERAKRVT